MASCLAYIALLAWLQYSRNPTPHLLTQTLPSPQAYGVHTSLEILPKVLFRRLALGCVIALGACPQRGGTT
ncbi:hypothetical protein [Nostoc sp. 106C]|uniref:hypothetical protein n=1 Tax=Nostoc sp. 106C TaxID=1932667 RepID=UPI000A3AEB96|nr:hypothetical protein [Nostoc sp. 106C]OUL28867.1 hypothetical protein BV375_17285 [Nostoc sp. 106C]